MLHKTKIGVCIDDSVAYLLEEKNEQNVITIIEAGENDPATAFLSQDEPVHDKQRQRHLFFKRIFDAIRDFDKIAFCGPASARREILNRIKANKLLNIEFQNTPENEKITENQKIEFISNYFGN